MLKNKQKRRNGKEKAEYRKQDEIRRDLKQKNQDRLMNGQQKKIEKSKEFKELKNLVELKQNLNLAGIDLFMKLIIKI